MADRELIQERLLRRKGHYMPASLLDSQIETLEPLEPDETGPRGAGGGPQEEVLADLLRALERL